MGFRGNPQLPTQRITPPVPPRLYPTHTLTPLNGIQCMLLTSTCPVAHSWNSPHCNACLLTEMCLLAFTAFTHPCAIVHSPLTDKQSHTNGEEVWPFSTAIRNSGGRTFSFFKFLSNCPRLKCILFFFY